MLGFYSHLENTFKTQPDQSNRLFRRPQMLENDDLHLNTSIGPDLRWANRGPYRPVRDRRDVKDREHQLIERAAARHLERATKGRLTFQGSTIVRTFATAV